MHVKRLRCPECGHERQPDPEPETGADGELKGWAAVYKPRHPANGMGRVAAMLQQLTMWSGLRFVMHRYPSPRDRRHPWRRA
jgi:hypothetical protein